MNCTDTFPDGLPADLDITSIDDYYLTVEEHREWYTTKLYPLMSPHQKVFLVPGSYGTRSGIENVRSLISSGFTFVLYRLGLRSSQSVLFSRVSRLCITTHWLLACDPLLPARAAAPLLNTRRHFNGAVAMVHKVRRVTGRNTR